MKTQPSLGSDLNGNPYLAKGSYRTPDGKAQIDWTLARSVKHGGQDADAAIFSASGHYLRTQSNSSGQCLEEIAKAYPSDEKVQAMVAVWRAHHGNDMRPGTPAQTALGWGKGFDVVLTRQTMTEPQIRALRRRNWIQSCGKNYRSPVIVARDLFAGNQRPAFEGGEGTTEVLALWRRMFPDSVGFTTHDREAIRTIAKGTGFSARYCGAARWNQLVTAYKTLITELAAEEDQAIANVPVKSEIFEDSIGAPCPETGELYGHKWFYHPIPADIVEQIKGWVAWDNTAGESSYDGQARGFLTRNGLEMRITKADSKPAPWAGEGTKSGHHYRVTLWRGKESAATANRLAFDFWGSVHDAEKRQDPSPYDVLACLSSDINVPETLKDYCDNFGGDPDSIRVRQTFNRINRFARQLKGFFTETEQQELAEIS